MCIRDSDTSADAMALLAAGQFNIIEGGLAAGYFNALAKKFPIIIASDRVSAPNNHRFVVRADLKWQIKSPADLKGRVVASNGGPGVVRRRHYGSVGEPLLPRISCSGSRRCWARLRFSLVALSLP